MKKYITQIGCRFYLRQFSKGFTLVELLVAISISIIVIILAGNALINIASFDNETAATIERQIDLNRAFDFISHEIRIAQRINRTANKVADGSATAWQSILTDSGLNASNLGSYGTIVLYLEVPINTIPTTCPAGSPHAGSPPPAPTKYDRIVYDIRPTTGSWLSPRVIARYGRIPSADGSIDPCKDPIHSDILVDSITDTDISPTCNSSAVRVGAGGFYACVEGSLVELYLRSQVADTEVVGKAFSRLSGYSADLAPVLSGAKSGVNSANLSWTWGGSGSANFNVYRTVNGGVSTVYSGSNLSFSDNTAMSGQNCYTVTATIGSYTSAASNAFCANF